MAVLRQPALLLAGFALVFGLGIAVRIYGLGDESLWFDEAVTAAYTKHGVRAAWAANLHDTTPPLYFIGLAAWRDYVPGSEAGLRSYSVCWSLIGLVAASALGWAVSESRTALICAALLAINPLDVYYAQEARPYAQAAALCTVATLLFWMVVFSGRVRRIAPAYALAIGYGIAASAIALTHYAALAVPASHAIILLLLWRCRKSRQTAGLALTAAAAAAVTVLPWAVAVMRTTGKLDTTNVSWMQWPRWWEFLVFPATQYFGGLASVPVWSWTAVLAMLLGVIAWNARRGRTTCSLPLVYLLLSLALPILVAVVGGAVLRQNLFAPTRFPLFVLPAFVLLLALARPQVIVCGVATLLMLLGLVHQKLTVHKADWRAFARMYRQSPPARVAFFPAYDAIAANHYLQPDVQNFTLQMLGSSVPFLANHDVWMVGEKAFGLELQEGEKIMRAELMKLGPVSALDAPPGLVIESVRVRGH